MLLSSNKQATNSRVQTVFCREEEVFRGASPSGSRARQTVLRALQSALGNVAYDREGRVFWTAPGGDKVRRVVKVDRTFTNPATSISELFDTVVDPVVTRAVEQHRDAVFICAGDTRSMKDRIIHGTMPSFTLDVPPRSAWGLAYRTVERLLEISESMAANQPWASSGAPNSPTTTPSGGLDITMTFTRVNLDHVSDMLVNTATQHQGKQAPPPDKVRAYYRRLVALSHGSALELVEAPDGAKVKFQALDQIETPIRRLEDFLHAVNCQGALHASSGPLLKLLSAKGSPFYAVLSFKFVPAAPPDALPESVVSTACPLEYSTMTRVPDAAEGAPNGKPEVVPRYINFVETGDLDWTGPEEDMAMFRSTFDTFAAYASAVHRGDAAGAEAQARACQATRVGVGNLDPRMVDVVVLGTARYSSAHRTMKRLAECKGQRPYVLLHGPDGAGADQVDEELRGHVMAVQDQCNLLRDEVNLLQRTRDDLLFRIQRDDTAISRMQEQQTLVRRMTLSAHAAREVTSHNQGATPEHKASERAAAAAAVAKEEASRRAAKLATMDRDLAAMKEDEARQAEATQQQIRFLNAESQRCARNASQLEAELASLERKVAQQDARFAQERQQRRTEMDKEIAAVVAENRARHEQQAAARRDAAKAAQEEQARRVELSVRQEQEYLKEMTRGTTVQARQIEAENAAWEQELTALSEELERVTRARNALAAEDAATEAQFRQELASLDVESTALCRYLNDITSALWRFENHTGSEVKRVVDVGKCGVGVFDPTAPHRPEDLERQCKHVRRWLESHGVPGPAVYHNIERDEVHLLSEGQQHLGG